jgi:hypothetical protein
MVHFHGFDVFKNINFDENDFGRSLVIMIH